MDDISQQLDELGTETRRIAVERGIHLVGIHLVAVGDENAEGETAIHKHVASVLPDEIYADMLEKSAAGVRKNDWDNT